MADIGSGELTQARNDAESAPSSAAATGFSSRLPLGVKIILLRGKIRRFVYGHFRRREVERMVARRRGECNRCGACCQILVKCVFYDQCREGAECRIYEKRPVNCRVFPMDPRDIEELNLMRPDKPCGYHFEN